MTSPTRKKKGKKSSSKALLQDSVSKKQQVPSTIFEGPDEDNDADDQTADEKEEQQQMKGPSTSIEQEDLSERTRAFRDERNRVQQQRVNVAKPDDVNTSYTSYNTATTIRTKDIIRIFTNDDEDEFIEITPEQLQRVKIMHNRISSGAKFSFNYNILLFVASILAGLGLVSNSGATIIASMLVSPIMGPVIGLAYGTTIRDWELVFSSMKTEFISLIYCIIAGITIGAMTGPTSLSDDWPTPEMDTRGEMSTFIVGLPTAFFSGLGVAVSLLDDQTSSLVGVAISASLLPPAVNAGIMWIAYAFTKADIIVATPLPIEPPPTDNITTYGRSSYGDTSIGDDNYEDDQYGLADYSKRGLLSLLLTLANIVLIWISSMLMFRIKEVLPIEKSIFWEDLGIARKVYQKRALIQHTHMVEKAPPTGSSFEEEISPNEE